jgi:hypothetical protein
MTPILASPWEIPMAIGMKGGKKGKRNIIFITETLKYNIAIGNLRK